MKKIMTMCLCLFCTTAWAQFSGEGAGTEKNPYLVTNADELFEVRNDMSAHYKLMNDIDLGTWLQEDSPKLGWAPIGTTTTPFTGVFDGANHVIDGLMINRAIDNVGLFGVVSGSVINVVLSNTNIHGNNCVGGAIGLLQKNVDIHDISLINTNIDGSDFVGGIIGNIQCELGYNMNVSQCVFSGGNIRGQNYVGGIVGAIGKTSDGFTGYCSTALSACACYATINAKNHCGGISGYAYGYYWTGMSNHINYTDCQNTIISDNIFSGKICSESATAGIIAEAYDWGRENYITVSRNIAAGNIFIEKEPAYGIVYVKDTRIACSANVCAMDTLDSKTSESVRVSNYGSDNNYVFNGMVVSINGHEQDVNDSPTNGVGYSMRMLKKKTTYEGLGYDFTNVWDIVEGETLPFINGQSHPVSIAEFEAGNKTQISGTVDFMSGMVFVLIRDNYYKTVVVDKKWSVNLGFINKGDVASVVAVELGKKPSIPVLVNATPKAVIEPVYISGDANGDETVDVSDVVSIINHLVGKTSDSFNEKNADVNQDGQVLVDDAVGTVEIILNSQK